GPVDLLIQRVELEFFNRTEQGSERDRMLMAGFRIERLQRWQRIVPTKPEYLGRIEMTPESRKGPVQLERRHQAPRISESSPTLKLPEKPVTDTRLPSILALIRVSVIRQSRPSSECDTLELRITLPRSTVTLGPTV